MGAMYFPQSKETGQCLRDVLEVFEGFQAERLGQLSRRIMATGPDTSAIPALMRLKQEDRSQLEASLGYTETLPQKSKSQSKQTRNPNQK